MKQGKILKKTPIHGLFIVNKPFYLDQRGFLQEFLRVNEFEIEGFNFKPVHAAISCSLPKVLRGIHTEAWSKLILPLTGKMFAAFVDVRVDSPTFLKVHTMVFDNQRLDTPRTPVLIPSGVGNSICVFGSDPVFYVYLNQDYWEPSKAKGIAWDDPDLAIDWPIKNPVISERDKNNPRIREIFPEIFK